MIRMIQRVRPFSHFYREGAHTPFSPLPGGAPLSSFPVFLEGFSRKTKPKVLITRPDLPQVVMDRIGDSCDVDTYEEERPMPRSELLERIQGKHGVLCLLTDQMDKEAIQAAGSDLKVISTMADGYDHIDLEECRAMGVVVGHTSGVLFSSVAEWTVLLMLAAGRNFLHAARALHTGEWQYAWSPSWLRGRGLVDAVVGIVGMGGIGQMVCQRVLPFGVKKVLYYDIFHPVIGADQLGAELVPLKRLLAESDFVVSTVNLWHDSEQMFDARAFGHMKTSAVFVNTSRGEVVNQDDLFRALKRQTIRGAALDVTTPEPLPKNHPLTTLDNIIITPHVASDETNVRFKMAELAAENLLLGLNGEELRTPVPM